jgi:adenosylcobinamide-phosphate synthase
MVSLRASGVGTGLAERAGAAGIGLLLDRLVGDPADTWHPVAWFGRAMGAAEERWYDDERSAGVRHALGGVALAGVAGAVVRSTAVSTTVAAGGRGLAEAARAVARPLEVGDLAAAREALPSLVGRDPSGLDHGEIARAVIESVAENTVDAVVAPAFWAVAAGAAGVLGHRAVNTLDAMVGHHDDRYERFGWASARLDDVAAWVPARITAVLVAAVRPARAGEVWSAVRLDAPAHPSPNSGVAEAAFAAALGLRLGGPSRYGDRLQERPVLGTGRLPSAADIEPAIRLSRDVTVALAGVLIGGAAVDRIRRHRP